LAASADQEYKLRAQLTLHFGKNSPNALEFHFLQIKVV
jgi:hypothetical protein